MHVVIVEFVAEAGFEAQLRTRLLKQATDSLTREDQCRVFDVCADPNNKARFVLYEVYDDADAFRLHLASEHFRTFDRDTADWVASKEVMQLERIGQ